MPQQEQPQQFISPVAEYYLHTNGNVIYKPHGGVDATSTLVVKVWNVKRVAESPVTYAEWLYELADLGASHSRLLQLWKLNNLSDFLGQTAEEHFNNHLKQIQEREDPHDQHDQ